MCKGGRRRRRSPKWWSRFRRWSGRNHGVCEVELGSRRVSCRSGSEVGTRLFHSLCPTCVIPKFVSDRFCQPRTQFFLFGSDRPKFSKEERKEPPMRRRFPSCCTRTTGRSTSFLPAPSFLFYCSSCGRGSARCTEMLEIDRFLKCLSCQSWCHVTDNANVSHSQMPNEIVYIDAL